MDCHTLKHRSERFKTPVPQSVRPNLHSVPSYTPKSLPSKRRTARRTHPHSNWRRPRTGINRPY